MRWSIDAAANEDAWALHVAERSMLGVVYPDRGKPEAAQPKAAPRATPVEAPAASLGQEDNVSEQETDSQAAAFETWLSEQPWNTRGPGETELHKVVREAMALSHENGVARGETPVRHANEECRGALDDRSLRGACRPAAKEDAVHVGE